MGTALDDVRDALAHVDETKRAWVEAREDAVRAVTAARESGFTTIAIADYTPGWSQQRVSELARGRR